MGQSWKSPSSPALHSGSKMADRVEDELAEVANRFQEEGLDINLPDSQKLLYLWRWLVDTETNCISLRHQLDKLSQQQSEKMKEFERHVEEVNRSSSEQVSRLKVENERLRLQLGIEHHSSGMAVNKEIREMLLQENLPEIANLDVSEQFAVLLVERAHMKEQLEQEQEKRRKREQTARLASNLPDSLKLSSPHVQRILEQQKEEYEEEMRHQQETMRHVKEQLRQVHEDEITRLTAEKSFLQEELSKARKKIEELVHCFSRNNSQDEEWGKSLIHHILDGGLEDQLKELEFERDQLKARCQELHRRARESNERIRLLERSNKQLELDNETLSYKLSETLAQFDELEDQLRKERFKGRRESLFKQASISDSPHKMDSLQSLPNSKLSVSQLDFQLVEQIKKLKGEVSKLQEQLGSVGSRLEAVSLKYQQRKMRHQERIHKLREYVEREQQAWKDGIKNLEKELTLSRDMLAKEQEWRMKLEKDCKQLQEEKREVQKRILDKEEIVKEKSRELLLLQGEIEKLKTPPVAHSLPSGSPRRNSVWPVMSHAKKW